MQCAAMRTNAVAVMTAISSNMGRIIFRATTRWATWTTAAMTTAWIMMLQALTAVPNKN
jgi:hypothetical protein